MDSTFFFKNVEIIILFVVKDISMKERVPQITVIVPCYNAADYLTLCCDDLKRQTFEDFEVLLVDDGSPDETGTLCDKIADIDARFRVIHQENGGVGKARNTGLLNARGEYVIHVDPDDRVDPEMLRCLYSCMISNNADMVISDYYEHNDSGEFYVTQTPKSLNHLEVLIEMFNSLHGSCCNKLVRKQLFKDYNISFPDLALCEDLYVNICLLLNPIKVAYLNQAFYHYERTNINSVTRKGNSAMGINAYNTCAAFRGLLEKNEELWAIFVKNEMHWMAFLSLYYGAVSATEFKEQFHELLFVKATSSRESLVYVALKYSYNVARMLLKIYKYLK